MNADIAPLNRHTNNGTGTQRARAGSDRWAWNVVLRL